MNCKLCGREIERLTIPYLIRRKKVKQKKAEAGSTISICSACHRQIHILFDNKRLAQELNSLEKLSDEPQMQRFLSWIKKQKPHKHVQVRHKQLKNTKLIGNT